MKPWYSITVAVILLMVMGVSRSAMADCSGNAGAKNTFICTIGFAEWYLWKDGKIYPENGCTTDFADKDVSGKPLPWQPNGAFNVYFEGGQYKVDWAYKSDGLPCVAGVWHYAAKDGSVDGIPNGFANIDSVKGFIQYSNFADAKPDTMNWCALKTVPVVVITAKMSDSMSNFMGKDAKSCLPEALAMQHSPICTDSDPNDDPSVIGNVKFSQSDGKKGETIYDTCDGEGWINQVSCSPSIEGLSTYKAHGEECPAGTTCKAGAAGACVDKATVYTPPADSTKPCVGMACMLKYLVQIQTPNTWYYWREGKIYTEYGCTTDFTEKDAAGNPIPWRPTKVANVYFEGKENGTDYIYESSGKCKTDVPWFYAQKNGKVNGIDNGFALPGNLIGPLYEPTIYNDTQKWCPTKTAPVYVSGKHLGTDWQYCSPEEVKYYSDPKTAVTSTIQSYAEKCDPDGNGYVNEAIKDPNLLADIQKILETTNISLELAKKVGDIDIQYHSGQDFTSSLFSSYMSGKNLISSLEGLQCFPALQQLNLPWNKINDLSPLAELAQLTNLQLFDNKVTDLKPLSELNELIVLEVGANPISNLKPLMGLQKLLTLGVGGCKISDITPLATLTQLAILDLNQQFVTNFLPSLPLSKQTTQFITNFQPLSTLVNLKRLNLNITNISNLAPLANLSKLVELDLAFNPITDITPLLSMANPKLGISLPANSGIPEAQIQKLKATGANVSFLP